MGELEEEKQREYKEAVENLNKTKNILNKWGCSDYVDERIDELIELFQWRIHAIENPEFGRKMEGHGIKF